MCVFVCLVSVSILDRICILFCFWLFFHSLLNTCLYTYTHLTTTLKWHLGESTRRFTPLDRGYDSYLGYLGGAECYWLHGTEKAIDFFDGYEPCFNYTCWDGNFCDINKYSANVLARRAADVIDEASRGDKPLFLYLAWQNVHSGNHEELQAPQSYIDSFNDTISHQKRRNLAGMIKSLDEGVANVTRALKEAGMFEDTLIIFSTDNGGPADNFNGNWASNWPLRGMKRTLFQGGVQGVGFLSGAGLSPARVGSVLTGMVHISDYLPSLLTMAARASDMPEFGPSATWRNVVSATAAAGGNYGLVDPPFVHGDGIDVWDYLSGVNETCPRTWVLHEAHPVNSTDGNGNALRVGDYKIVLRTGASWSRGSIAGTNDGWYGGFGSTDQSNDGYALPTGKHTEPWVVKCPPPPTNVTEGYACEQIKNGAGADDPKYACLFNIAEDPCEHKDLSAEQPEKVTEMMEALATFRATAVNSATATHNPDGANCPAVRVVEGCGPEGSKAPMECHAEAWCHGKP